MDDVRERIASNGEWGDGRIVLVVEDEQPLQTMIVRTLARHRHRLIAVDTVRGAIAEMTERLPDVVLLDINLPDGTGWEVLRWIRTTGLRLPAIVYSAVPPSPKRIAELHPDAVLTKPFPMDCLLDLIASVGRRDDAVPARAVRS